MIFLTIHTFKVMKDWPSKMSKFPMQRKESELSFGTRFNQSFSYDQLYLATWSRALQLSSICLSFIERQRIGTVSKSFLTVLLFKVFHENPLK